MQTVAESRSSQDSRCATAQTPLTVLHVAMTKGDPQPALAEALVQLADGGNVVTFPWQECQRNVSAEILKTALESRPDITFMQIQTPDVLSPEDAKRMPGFVVNWTGDVRAKLPEWYGSIGKNIALTCATNGKDVDELNSMGVNSKFLQIGFNNKTFNPIGPSRSPHPIVFFGNNYPESNFELSGFRYDAVVALRKHFGKYFGLYGCNWPKEFRATNLMGKQYVEAEIYRGADVALSISHFNRSRYFSDRLLRIMGSGCLALSHRYEDLSVDWTDGKELVTFAQTTDSICDAVEEVLVEDSDLYKEIAKDGCHYAHTYHTWSSRMWELREWYDAWV